MYVFKAVLNVHVDVVVVCEAINFAIDIGEVWVSTAVVPLAVVQLEVELPASDFAFSHADGVNVTYMLRVFAPEEDPSRWYDNE